MLKPPVNEHDHTSGSNSAPVTLVEYGDYQCPHCGHAYPLIKQIQEKLGDDLRFVFRNFPLSEMHPQALMAAIATEAAAKQHAYWPMHDIIFENQQKLSGDNLLKFAATLHLDTKAFARDMEDKVQQQKVEDDFESGIMSGVNGTPTFFVNGSRYNGGLENDEFLHFLKAAIAHPHTP